MGTAVEKRRSFIINFIYFGIIIGLYYFVIKFAFGYVFPFVFAAALAVALQRPVRAIGKKLHVKAHSVISTIIVLLIVMAVVGIISGAITGLVNEFMDFFTYLTSQFDSLGAFLEAIENDIINLVRKLPAGIELTVEGYVTNFFQKIGANDSINATAGSIDPQVILKPLEGAWGVVKGIPSILLSVLVTIISCVFMTSEYGDIRNMIFSACSEEKKKKIIHAKRTVIQGVGKLCKAYATIMLITFAEMFLGLNLLKLIGVYGGGYIAIISLVTCIVDIVPVLGTGTIIIPWALYSIITGEYGFGIGLIVLYVVITVLRQAIEPRLVAHQVGLPAIITIMAMFIGAKLFGAIGIVILPLTVVVVKLMYDDGIIGSKKIIEKENADAKAKEEAIENAEVKND